MPLEIPLKAIAFNSVSVVLDDEQFIIQTIWRDRDEVWKLNILSGDKEDIITGLSILPTRPLTLEYKHKVSPKGIFSVESIGGDTSSFNSLGSSIRLLYHTEEELNELLQ